MRNFCWIATTLLCVTVSSQLSAQSLEKPIQLSLWEPVQIFKKETSIHGIRLNLLYGVNKDMFGIDLGLVNRVTGEFTGLQKGLINVNERHSSGLQIGFINTSGSMKGVQFGVVNITDTMHGLQLGLANVIKRDSPVKFLPFINFCFSK